MNLIHSALSAIRSRVLALKKRHVALQNKTPPWVKPNVPPEFKRDHVKRVLAAHDKRVTRMERNRRVQHGERTLTCDVCRKKTGQLTCMPSSLGKKMCNKCLTASGYKII